MAPDPLHPHPPAGDLEGSTAITPVTSDVMAHAAQQAAELVADVANRSQAAPSKGGRGTRKTATEAPSVAGDTAPVEIAAAEPPAETDALEPDAVAATPASEAPTDVQPPVADAPALAMVPDAEPEAIVAAALDSVAEQGPALSRLTAVSAHALRTNIDAMFEFWTSMMGVKSISEALSLNAFFMRQQVEAVTAQSRDFSALAQQLAAESLSRFAGLSDRP